MPNRLSCLYPDDDDTVETGASRYHGSEIFLDRATGEETHFGSEGMHSSEECLFDKLSPKSPLSRGSQITRVSLISSARSRRDQKASVTTEMTEAPRSPGMYAVNAGQRHTIKIAKESTDFIVSVNGDGNTFVALELPETIPVMTFDCWETTGETEVTVRLRGGKPASARYHVEPGTRLMTRGTEVRSRSAQQKQSPFKQSKDWTL